MSCYEIVLVIFLNSHFFAPHPFFKAQAYCSQRVTHGEVPAY